MTKVAAVLGAGMQGCCAALALTKLGFHVKLYDKKASLMSRASVNQEGKIHLGFVYARDQSMITARTMIEHALQFAPAVESLIGEVDWETHLSNRFYCGIHKDSSLSIEEHYHHFAVLQEIYEDVSESTGSHYLGRTPKRIWHDDISFQFKSRDIVHAVATEETAVEPVWMRKCVTAAIEQNSHITPYLLHEIRHVDRVKQSFHIRAVHQDEVATHSADVVVNCLWEGKRGIDNTLGLQSSADWVTRIKYGFVLAASPQFRDIPSLILTHGPFGDIVNYPFNDTTYITWYPSCLTYLSNANNLPTDWEQACDGIHSPELVQRIFTESIRVLAEYVPELADLPLKQVMAGAIMGQGRTDITDLKSGLHLRHGIGVSSSEDYYSIFTGKYTSAPANAIELQEMLA